MTRTSDEAPEPVTERLRGADLRARAPQSAIPTQGGPPLPPPRSGPFPMGPRVVGPPSGPAQRSPLVTPQGRPTPQHPSGEQTPLHDDGSVPVKVRLEAWGRQLREVVSTPTGRWSVIGVVAVLQVFLLFSTVMWWAGGGSTVTASSKLAPMTWTGIVYDVGAAGVNLRSATTVTPDSAKDTAARGSRLAVSCGQTGDVVQKGAVNTATWLKTTDGLFVSMLYVRIPDRQSIPSCADSSVDAPLLALAHPGNPDLPPPPGANAVAVGKDGVTAATGRPGGPAPQPPVALPAGAPAPGASSGTAPTAPKAQAADTPPIFGDNSTSTVTLDDNSDNSVDNSNQDNSTDTDASTNDSGNVVDNPDVLPRG